MVVEATSAQTAFSCFIAGMDVKILNLLDAGFFLAKSSANFDLGIVGRRLPRYRYFS